MSFMKNYCHLRELINLREPEIHFALVEYFPGGFLSDFYSKLVRSNAHAEVNAKSLINDKEGFGVVRIIGSFGKLH